MAVSSIQIFEQKPEKISGDILMYYKGDKIHVCGKTFNIKEQIKALRGLWDSKEKCWKVPLSNESKLVDLIEETFYPKEEIEEIEESVDLIPIVDLLPKRHSGGLGIYRMGSSIYVCGSKTSSLKTKLLKLGGKQDSESKCWILSLNRASQILDIKDEVEESIQQRKITKQQQFVEEKELQGRLSQPEREAGYISHFNLLAKDADTASIVEASKLDRDDLYDQWKDKIQILETTGSRGTSQAIVTYKGELKPPDEAFLYAVDGWHPYHFGGDVKRIDYKIYQVVVYAD